MSDKKWQARRDSNPHHPDLESGALAVGATGLKTLLNLLVNRVSTTALYKSHPWPRPGLSVVEHPTEESHQGGPIV